jgi:predicted RNase H-like nuclease (RuvC/YqgF family)
LWYIDLSTVHDIGITDGSVHSLLYKSKDTTQGSTGDLVKELLEESENDIIEHHEELTLTDTINQDSRKDTGQNNHQTANYLKRIISLKEKNTSLKLEIITLQEENSTLNKKLSEYKAASVNVSEIQKQVHEKDSHIAHLMREKKESTGEAREQFQQDYKKFSIDDEPSSIDSLNTIHIITTLLSHELMNKTKLIKGECFITSLNYFIVTRSLYGRSCFDFHHCISNNW